MSPTRILVQCGFLLAIASAAAHADSTATPRVRLFRVLPGDSARVDVAAAVVPAKGGAIVAGWSIAGGQSDGLLLRVDGEGNVLWRMTPGGLGDDLLFALVEQPGGDFLAVGMAPGTAGGSEGWSLGFDREGRILSSNRLGGTGSVRFTSVERDGKGVLIAGEQAGADSTLAMIHRPSPEPLRMYWRTWRGGGGTTRGFAAAPAGGGDAILVGTIADGADPGDGFVTRLARSGAARWTHRIAGAGRQLAYHLSAFPDSSWLVAGYGDTGAGRGVDGFALAIDGAGRVRFDTALGDSGDDRAVHGLAFTDGSAAVVGYARARGAAADDPSWTTTVYGLDAQGRRTWTRALGGPGRDSGRWIAGTRDDLWVVGQEAAADGGSRVFVARLDVSGASPASSPPAPR